MMYSLNEIASIARLNDGHRPIDSENIVGLRFFM